MKNLFYLTTLLCFLLAVESCQLSNECLDQGQGTVNQLEFIVVDKNDKQYLGIDTATLYYELCSAFVADTVPGFNGIYSFSGIISYDCTGGCLTLYDVKNPFCAVAFTIATENSPLLGDWKYLKMETPQGTLHPSCLTNMQFAIDLAAGSGLSVSGRIGANDILWVLQNVGGTYTKSTFQYGDRLVQPYVEVVEKAIVNFISNNDTFQFQIDRNVLTISGDITSETIQLYKN